MSGACAATQSESIAMMASDGATYSHQIDETSDGWRASALIKLEKGNETLTQSLGPEMFSTYEAAREWVGREAAARGFDPRLSDGA
jgi:hypothetical protein